MEHTCLSVLALHVSFEYAPKFKILMLGILVFLENF